MTKTQGLSHLTVTGPYPPLRGSVVEGRVVCKTHGSHLQGNNGERKRSVCVFRKQKSKEKRQWHKIHPKAMAPCPTRSLESSRYGPEGQAHKWVILLSRGSTKDGLFESGLEDGKNLDTQMEWGPEGISGGEWRKQRLRA